MMSRGASDTGAAGLGGGSASASSGFGGFTSSSFSAGYGSGSNFGGTTGGYTASRGSNYGAGSGGHTTDAGYGAGLGQRDGNTDSFGVGGGYSGYSPGGVFDTTLAAEDPHQTPETEPWEPKHTFGRIGVTLMLIMKLLDLVTEILKVAVNGDAADDMFGWACLNIAMAGFLMFQRIYDHCYLLFKSLSASKGKFNIVSNRPLCSCMCLPFTIIHLPFTIFANTMYKLKTTQWHTEALQTTDLTIFTQRPLSTVILSLPLYGIVGHCIMDEELLLHPMMVHMRTIHNLFQTLLEDIPSLVIDGLIIAAARDRGLKDDDIAFFWISFCYSALHTIIIIALTAKEIIDHEEHHSHPVDSKSTTVGKTSNA